MDKNGIRITVTTVHSNKLYTSRYRIFTKYVTIFI